MIERAGPNDLMQLASDVGPVPMQIAGVLLLEPRPGFDLDAACALTRDRLGRVPRLRQRLVRVPIGCGRPIWVDDVAFDPTQHVSVVTCPEPGDEAALLAIALALVARPLPRRRALWSATFVTGLSDRRVALVVVLHHVVADGLGGLALLAGLVDGESGREGPGPSGFPRPMPTRRALAADAWSARLRATARVPMQLRRLRAALAELGATRASLAPRTSLNKPTGPRREVGIVQADLDAAVAAAHRHGATVNDVVLTAVTGAIAAVLTGRGEAVPRLVVSVPVSARDTASATELGNRVGVIPMALPTEGDPVARLKVVAAITRSHKTATPGASAAMLQPAFRALSALGVLGWFIDRQRLVNAFVTNVRGPVSQMTFLDCTVRGVIPLSGTQGNVPVAFAVLSYAGALTITVLADPDAIPELPALTAELQHELDALTATAQDSR